MQRIGTVQRIQRFPVKSFRGHRLTEARVALHGLELDRMYAFVDPAERPSFPWLTGRKVAEMILFTPHLAGTDADGRVAVDVETPEGARHRLTDPAFLAALKARWGREFELRYDPRGMHDARPVSIFGRATLERLEAETGLRLDPARFRPNLVVDFEDRDAFYEDTLIGSRLRIGESVVLEADSKNRRCVMINLEPSDSAASPQVLQRVGKGYKGYAGIYAKPLSEGLVREGDPVYLL